MPPADGSRSAEPGPDRDIPALEAEIAALRGERETVMALIRERRAAEDPARRVFHAQEIFRLQQEKLRLDVDIQFRVNKINRIRLGIDGLDPGPPRDGFPF